MQESGDNKEYIVERRRHFLWIVFSLILFGAILYFASIFSNYAEKHDLENFDDAKNYFVKIVKKSFSIFPEGDTLKDEKGGFEKEEISTNILEVPLLLNCSLEEGKAFVKEPFEVLGNKVTNAVFELNSHGNTLYSSSFSSKENTVSCRGTMKEGEKKIFIYFCEKIKENATIETTNI